MRILVFFNQDVPPPCSHRAEQRRRRVGAGVGQSGWINRAGVGGADPSFFTVFLHQGDERQGGNIGPSHDNLVRVKFFKFLVKAGLGCADTFGQGHRGSDVAFLAQRALEVDPSPLVLKLKFHREGAEAAGFAAATKVSTGSVSHELNVGSAAKCIGGDPHRLGGGPDISTDFGDCRIPDAIVQARRQGAAVANAHRSQVGTEENGRPVPLSSASLRSDVSLGLVKMGSACWAGGGGFSHFRQMG